MATYEACSPNSALAIANRIRERLDAQSANQKSREKHLASTNPTSPETERLVFSPRPSPPRASGSSGDLGPQKSEAKVHAQSEEEEPSVSEKPKVTPNRSNPLKRPSSRGRGRRRGRGKAHGKRQDDDDLDFDEKLHPRNLHQLQRPRTPKVMLTWGPLLHRTSCLG